MIQKDFTEEEIRLIEENNYTNGYSYSRKHIAYKKRAENIANHTKEEWLKLCKKYNFLCCKCGSEVIGGIPTKDHIIPTALGGTSHIDNIQPLCRQCNVSKGRNTISYL